MILVTGAAGFIGREVCRQLIETGEEVFGIDRAASQERQRRNLEGIDLTELVEADLLELDLVSILRKVNGIVHLAGSPGVQTSWSGGFGTHLTNNVLTTQLLAEAMLDVPSQRMVVASSSSVYGHVESAASGANERRVLSPMSPYGASKAAMEHVVEAYSHRGLDVVPLRYFTVYGPHQRPDMAMNKMVEALKTGTPFTVRGDGSQERNYTYVSDAASATLKALSAPGLEGDPINVGGSETVSLNQVLDVFGQLAGYSVPTSEVAPVAGDPQRTAADTSLANELLGWKPQVSLREGLARQYEWQAGVAQATESLVVG